MLDIIMSALSKEQTGSADQPETAKSHLYHCSTCDNVYIAPDKKICSQCNTPVERVPSALSAE